MEETIWVYNAKPSDVRELIKSAGNQIGSVHFLKRKDGALRKMTYRLHVKSPTVAKKPIGVVFDGVETEDTTVPLTDAKLVIGQNSNGSKHVVVYPGMHGSVSGISRKDVDLSNDQMTVLDTNKVVRDNSGVAIGRGAWRTIPLENVIQVTVNGKKYILRK